MIRKLDFDIETITPMFLAGADQNKAELRAASIKGLLRFWWRTLQAEPDLENLREKESEIFGCSNKKVGGSSFSLRVWFEKPHIPMNEKFPKQIIQVTSKGKTFPVNILEYLAYGTLEYKKGQGNVFVREYFPGGTEFRLCVSFRKNCVDELIRTFFIFWMFGGIGSRSRNGFGSFHLNNYKAILSGVDLPHDYSMLIRKIIRDKPPQSYPSFVTGTKLFKTKTTHETWDNALAEVGKIYRGIRSGEIKANNEIFEKKHLYEKRQYMGAPIIVDKKDKSFLDRHAKPYFIKIAKENNRYRGYILYLPSKYCDGLEKDRSGRSINHGLEDKKFAEVCSEFNMFLSQYMDTVI